MKGKNEMKSKIKQTLVLFTMAVLLMQAVFGSLPAMATSNPSLLQVTMMTNGQPYIEGESTTSPVEVQVTMTSTDSANVEFSQDLGTTWQSFNVAQPWIVEEAGEHSLWFRLAGPNEQLQKYTIRIAPSKLQRLQFTQKMNTVIYVNAGATGKKDGTSWEDAFDNLQSALDIVQSEQQIWLAKGTYIPTQAIDQADARTVTFQLKNDVAIYGGFIGTETNVAGRNWKVNETIISGDIGTVGNNTDNAYRVFYHPDSLNLNATAVLDGVMIIGGNANGDIPYRSGSGMYNNTSSPTLTNVTFHANIADSEGGGMYNANSSPTLNNVIFLENKAKSGGGMYSIAASSPILTNVMFRDNKAESGGGMFSDGFSKVALTKVLFHGNIADSKGGSIYNSNLSTSELTNVMFSKNTASSGSVIFNNGFNFLALTNVTISGNESTGNEKGAIYGGFGAIWNSIIVGNYNEPAISNYNGMIEDSLIDVEENGVVLAKFHKTKADIEMYTYSPDAIFIDPSQPDYRLRANSPAINKGNNSNNATLTDLAGNSRIQAGTIDLGAYEAFPYTVTYEKNGPTGDVPIDKETYNQGHQVTVQNNNGNLVKAGYTFTGWNTQADGKGTHYAENATFPMGTANVILYAEWTVNPTYQVQYDGNGATGGQVPQDNKAYAENEMVIVQSNNGNLMRTGYAFKGWNTQADGKGISYAENATLPIGKANVTLYAEWIKNSTYTVKYNANGATDGQVPQDNNEYEENETVIVQNNGGKLVRKDYTFKGWNTRADGKGTSYAENATFPMGKINVTLYAQWTVNPPTTGGNTAPPASNDNDFSPPTTVKITLHTNGGTTLAPIEIAYNTKVSDLPVPTREGFRFDGWYQDVSFTKQWAEETLVRENIALYAKWTALPVTESETPQVPQQPQPTKPVVTFSDIERHWAKEMVEELATIGIIQGYQDGTFRPNAPISRMHVVALLTRAFSFEPVREAYDFSDVSSTHPYYDAIITLQQAGIIDGTNGAFLPAENMTRAQLAKVLVGVLGLTPEGTSSFADVDSEHWSAGYIAVLEHEGIALGDNGKFRPNEPVTRAQFVAFLYRIMQQ